MHEAEAKCILSSHGRMNPYRGCSHGCIYCDSRSKCYGFAHDFSDVEVKVNAPELLENALLHKRKRSMIGTGSMCDPYQDAEEKYRITEKCALIAEKYGFGFTFITKSSRCLRDIDIFNCINEKTKCVVQMTLTTSDTNVCRVLEPNVSDTYERAEALERFKNAGIPSVVWLSPFLPYINDTEENLRSLLEICAAVGVRHIVNFGIGLTLREGSREYFYRELDRHFPGLSDRYRHDFGYSYVCASQNNDRLMRIFTDFCDKYGIGSDPGHAFAYLGEFEDKRMGNQLALDIF